LNLQTTANKLFNHKKDCQNAKKTPESQRNINTIVHYRPAELIQTV